MKLDVKAFAFSTAIVFAVFMFVLGMWHSITGYGTITSAVVQGTNIKVIKGNVVYVSSSGGKKKVYLAVSTPNVANRVLGLWLKSIYPGLPDFVFDPSIPWFKNFTANIFPSLLLTIYGFVDGFIVGVLFAFLYNLLVKKRESAK